MGARTPEELDTLLEDAIVVGDPREVRGLFEDTGVLALCDAERRGEDIGRWDPAAAVYIAAPRRIVQARHTALLVGPCGVGVVHRGPDAMWRFAIALLEPDPKETR
jgi:hypothetical protein